MKNKLEKEAKEIILSRCACGMVQDIDGSYMTEQQAEQKYAGMQIKYSHGALSLNCLARYYGFSLDWKKIPINCSDRRK